jgi:hypothetical protein
MVMWWWRSHGDVVVGVIMVMWGDHGDGWDGQPWVKWRKMMVWVNMNVMW